MESAALSTCLRYIAPTDSVLLSGNAVNCLLTTQWQQALAAHNVMLLRDDVVARGLTTRLSQAKLIDMSEFVALTLTHSKVISW
ncbi:sulfurtransferase complex subunit TusB [Shewanella sp.]|nr:sulfurtransferase complex subunit TusB [Shewanella sp.]